jgi:hypothetical protein
MENDSGQGQFSNFARAVKGPRHASPLHYLILLLPVWLPQKRFLRPPPDCGTTAASAPGSVPAILCCRSSGVEHVLGKDGVVGSIPIGSTSLFNGLDF